MNLDKASDYKRQAERFKTGDRSMLVLPFDYVLLSELPIEGTMVAGLYPIGKSAKELTTGKLKQAKVNTGTIAARLRALTLFGLVVQVRMVANAGSTAYQRTKLAEKELTAWNPPQA